MWTPEAFLTELPARVQITVEQRTVHIRAWRYDVTGHGGGVGVEDEMPAQVGGGQADGRHAEPGGSGQLLAAAVADVDELVETDDAARIGELEQAIEDNGEAWKAAYVYVAGIAPLGSLDDFWEQFEAPDTLAAAPPRGHWRAGRGRRPRRRRTTGRCR